MRQRILAVARYLGWRYLAALGEDPHRLTDIGTAVVPATVRYWRGTR